MNLANKISVARILLAPCLVASLLYYHPTRDWLRYVTLVLFIIGVLSDAVDGYIARSKKQQSELGAILDPIADKVLILSALISLSSIHGLPAWMQIPAWFNLIVISRDVLLVAGTALLFVLTGTITVRPRIAIPVYLFLDGHEAPQGRIAAFHAEAGPQPGVVALRLTLANDGPVHVRPSGSVLVSDSQGAVISRLPLGRVIPVFPQFQEKIPLLLPLGPGRYTAVATVDAGGQAPLQQMVSFEVKGDGRVNSI
jgi:phosphatidylglycerophosphate synthase